MRRLVVVLGFVAGCDYMFNLDHLKAPPVDAERLTGCFGKYGPGMSGLAKVCLDTPPQETWTHTGELNTGGPTNDCTLVLPQNGTSTELCVIAAHNIELGAYLPTSGARPIVFVATNTFTLLADATIGVDSRRGTGRNGAGTNETDCATAAVGMMYPMGASGGAGGSFASRGGKGGAGSGGQAGPVSNPALTGLAFVRAWRFRRRPHPSGLVRRRGLHHRRHARRHSRHDRRIG